MQTRAAVTERPRPLLGNDTIDSQIKFRGPIYCPVIALRGPQYLAICGCKGRWKFFQLIKIQNPVCYDNCHVSQIFEPFLYPYNSTNLFVKDYS